MKINGKELNTLSESSIVLEIIGLPSNMFGKHVEASIEAEEMVVRATMGAGDKEIYKIMISSVKTHPLFLKRVVTEEGYEYVFKVPEEHKSKFLHYTFYHKPQYQSKRSLVQRLLGKLW